MIKCQQLNILCFGNLHCHQLEIKEGQKRKNCANYLFLTLCRTKERGMELANGMDDSCLFLTEILHVLLTLEMLYERKYSMQTLKRLHLLQRKHRSNRMLLGNKSKKMNCWQNQWVMITDHQASVDFLFSNFCLSMCGTIVK